MPSPLGHALGGMAAGWLIAGRPAARSNRATRATDGARARDGSAWHRAWQRPLVRSAAWFGLLGALPDVDFLVGAHSTYTHSLGAIVLVGVAVLAFAGAGRWPFALASAAAYGTHVLFDWLGNDNSPPIGIMALWPISTGFHQSDAHVFEAISRRYWLPGFVAHNLRAVWSELVLLVPLVLLIGWFRRPSRPVQGVHSRQRERRAEAAPPADPPP